MLRGSQAAEFWYTGMYMVRGLRVTIFGVLAIGLLGTVLYSFLPTYASPAMAQALTEEEKSKLQAELDRLQKEIDQWQSVLVETRAKKGTLQGDVTLLDAQIKKAEAEIRQRNVTITSLARDIREKTARITTLEDSLARGHESLAKLLRQKDETETLSLVFLALSSQSLSDFFADLAAIDTIDRSLQEKFTELRSTRTLTQKERDALAAKQDQELNVKKDVEVKKNTIAVSQTQKKELLAVTVDQEKTYSQVLADRQAKAATIRARLFPLRDAAGIQFGDAVSYAQQAAAKTGVRAALILAFLSQESDLGKNVGNCLVTDLTTGNGKGKNTGTPFSGVMKSPRDTVPFAAITKALGLDWSTTPVSCPQSFGYGGAMGPAQFIPSTWQMFAPRIAAALGVAQANPWLARDAVMANAIYIADLGAGSQTYTSERNAACRYFSGSPCSASNGVIASYGDSVVAKANKFQQDIDFLSDI